MPVVLTARNSGNEDSDYCFAAADEPENLRVASLDPEHIAGSGGHQKERGGQTLRKVGGVTARNQKSVLWCLVRVRSVQETCWPRLYL